MLKHAKHQPSAPAAREPVTLADLFAKIEHMLREGAIDQPELFKMYREATGLTADDANIAYEAGPVFDTNETARAKMMDMLEAV